MRSIQKFCGNSTIKIFAQYRNFAVLFFALTGISNAALAPKNLTALIDAIEGIRKQENIAAVGLVIIENGDSVWLGGLGTLAHDSSTAVTADTVFRIGSITKTFTALAVLKLVERNQLALNDPISKWVPKSLYQNRWRPDHAIKLAYLLEHTAGFRDISKAEFDYNAPDPHPVVKTLRQFKDSHRTVWPPGLHSSYSNLGAAYAGYIIEQASDMQYETFLEQNIFQPLAMHQTGFFLTDNTPLAAGYNRDGKTPIPYWHMVYRPFGGINSTVTDMAQFLNMLIRHGEYKGKAIFSKQAIARMEHPQSTLAVRSGLRYGYGLGNYQWLHKGILFHGHGGDADGYLSRYAYTRSNNSGYFVVITAFNHAAINRIESQLEDYLTRNTSPPRPPKPYELNAETLKRISGAYRKVSSRFGKLHTEPVMRIEVDNNKLYTQFKRRKRIQLIPVNNQHFRRKNEPFATIAIIQTEDGNIYYQDDSDNLIKMK